MGGRGRGRGRGRQAMSFSAEQLGALTGGGGAESLPEPVLQPPPTFPPLDNRPAAIDASPKYLDRLIFKRGFTEQFSQVRKVLSPSKVQAENLTLSSLEYDWTRFPSELRPNAPKIKRFAKRTTATSNVNDLLNLLEQKEAQIKIEPEDEEEGEKRAEDEEVEDEQGDDEDEEMDEGTDYNQNYFDNGEGYLDDDDDADDGPVF